ncbi:MAG: M3 family metallopeptidase, partial [Propionibacteriaceae bacterium]
GMLSNCKYARLSGTNVSRDFVEFPSQVNEMWATAPEIMANYAIHVETGETIDPEIITKLEQSSTFNQGYETSAYLAAALVDQEWHKIAPDAEIISVADFEHKALVAVGLDNPLVPPRYKSAYFNHTFGGGYDAGYYAYIWSEILDADTVAWFSENGGLTRANGDHFRAELLSRGRSREPMDSYLAFRGQEPEMKHLLERRGLSTQS